MHKASLRASSSALMTGGGVAVLRPPKPPCWRDFVAQDSTRSKDHLTPPSSFIQPDTRNNADLAGGTGGGDTADSYSLGAGRLSSQLNVPGSTSRTSRSTKRLRARIHRTRSEHLIDVEELPEGELTVNLADTRPHDLKMHVRPAAEVDERLYVEENNRRCQSWLASIEAAEPLDDIGYTHTKDCEETGLEEVDVEVPEETFSWLGEEEEGEKEVVKVGVTTSTSSSDTEGLLQHVMAAVGLADPGSDGEQEEGGNSKQAPRGRGRESNGAGGLRATSSSLNIHRKLSSKHILSLSEHSGLE
ncbi:hypothetical protein ACOMHN_035775 [Nucella lapillus]